MGIQPAQNDLGVGEDLVCNARKGDPVIVVAIRFVIFKAFVQFSSYQGGSSFRLDGLFSI